MDDLEILNTILDMESKYNKSSMENIKENLYQIKLKKKEQYKKNCKRMGNKVGKFRILEDICTEQAEHSYTNKSHPSKIPFMTLIKICSHLKVSFENIIKEPGQRESNRIAYKAIKWTEEKIQEFIKDYDNGIRLEDIGLKYEISVSSVIRFHQLFIEGKDVNGRMRYVDFE